ncbi:MAG: hypothetical protein J5661_01740 [Bacteroidaceae bacterium]|nr:hypothetical protein [Bacteroidaceae bacterium]
MKRLFLYIILMMASVTGNLLAEENVRVSVTPQDTRQWQVAVALESNSPSVFCGFQMDLLLPTGVTYQEGTIKTGERTSDYRIMLTQLSAENLRVLSYSDSQKSIAAGSGNLFTLLLSGDESLTGKENLVLKNIRFSDAKGNETTIQGVSVDLSTGVCRILADEYAGRIYSLQGVCLEATSLSQLRAGIYIVNGRKVMVR